MSKVWIYFFFAIALLTGCATTGSPTFLPPAGTEIRVTQELSVRGGSRLHIQNGEVLARRDIGVLNPYCVFRMSRTGEEQNTPLVIEPGVFTVTRSFQELDFAWAEGLQFASRISNRSMTTIMELSSDTQPEVRQLNCIRWGDRRLDGYVTIPEMQATLGGLVSMTLADPS